MTNPGVQVNDHGPNPEPVTFPAVQVPALFGRWAGGHDPDPDRGTVVAPTRSPAGRRVTYPPSVPDGRPVPARHPGVQLPLTTVEPVNDHGGGPELAVALALQRAHTGGVTRQGQGYLDEGVPTSGLLAATFTELADTGLLAVADPDPRGLRWVSLTKNGHAHYEQLRSTPGRSGLPVLDPQFPTPKTPAGRRVSCPAPLPALGGQPDPHAGYLRWARSPQQRLHLLHPTELTHATQGHGRAVCGHPVTAQDLTITSGPPRALCLTCLAQAASLTSDPRPERHRSRPPGSSRSVTTTRTPWPPSSPTWSAGSPDQGGR